ncbi:MAG: hypothetical protein HQ509_04680 [Candidatus Marinimicrobia bacterium]|nr:hypothetical protein [Candidatus Neomarinimicrobiota bacterium]
MSCATSRYTAFQDGKTIGAGNTDLCMGLTFGPNCELLKIVDSTGFAKLDYKTNSTLTSLFSIDGRQGLQDNFDWGIGVGLDAELLHMKLFGKLSLLDQYVHKKLGIALIPTINIGGTYEEEEKETFDKRIENVKYIKFQLLTPISYSSNKLIVSVCPIAGWGKYMVKHKVGDNTIFKDSIIYHSLGLMFGMKYRIEKGRAKGYVFPELAIIYNDYTKKYHPYFGVGIGGNLDSWH